MIDRNEYAHFSNIEKGGYVISDSDNPDVLIFATGSEVWVALEVKKLLSDKYKVKVVNLCCWELFEEQEKSYKKSVLDCNSDTLLVSINICYIYAHTYYILLYSFGMSFHVYNNRNSIM